MDDPRSVHIKENPQDFFSESAEFYFSSFDISLFYGQFLNGESLLQKDILWNKNITVGAVIIRVITAAACAPGITNNVGTATFTVSGSANHH